MSYNSHNHLRCLAVTIKGNTTYCSKSLQYLLYGHSTNLIVRCKSVWGSGNCLSYNKERRRFLNKGKYNRITQNQTFGTIETWKDFFLFKTGPVNSGFSSGCERYPSTISKVKRGFSDCVIMAQSKLSVGHDQINNYFYITLGENTPSSGTIAKLEYAWLSPDLVDMYHTEVPPEFRGQGVAKILATTAFDYFSEKNVKMRPSCTYLQKYLKDNPIPQYLDHVEKEFKEF